MKKPQSDPLNSIDPRARVVCAAGLCIATAWVQQPHADILAAMVPLLAGMLAGFPFRRLWLVILRLNSLFLLMALMTLPFVEGPTWRTFGPLTITRPGLELMGNIVVKGNTLVFCCAVFLSSMEPATLGHALGRLGIPTTFVQLLMSVIRYIDVLIEEHNRIRLAMRARGFWPGCNMRTVRTHALAVGTLFLRSLERAERVADAMKCRGYHGVYVATRTLKWRPSDSVLTGLIIVIIATMGWVG